MRLVVVRGVLLNAAVAIDLHIPVSIRTEDALGLAEDSFTIDLGAPLPVRQVSLLVPVE